MAKLLTNSTGVSTIQTADKNACLAVLQTIFSAIKTAHS